VNRYFAYILGPELTWVLLLIVTVLLVMRNEPSTEAGNQQLENIGWFLPIVGVTLSFIPLAWAPGSQWVWLLRIGLVGLVGVCLVTSILCGGINYNDSRNSGVGTAYVLFIGLGITALLFGGLMATIFFITKWRFLPLLKWVLIIFGVLTVCWRILLWLASFGKKNIP
jgi:hypothetical protein